jgi:HlyD family secretion protein
MTGMVLAESAEPDEVLAAGTPFATLGDVDHPWVRAYIAETDLGRVCVGDPVEVKSDTFPDKRYEGRVSFIASEAEFTPKQIQTREERTRLVYRVKVDLPNPNHELKLNMPVEGRIIPNPARNP